jgi:ribosomal protein S18 acetylase RimI-like enzyme
MYVNLIYSKLSDKKKTKINHFIKSCFNSVDDIAMDDYTIIILKMVADKMVGCICLLDKKHLQEKIIKEKLNNNCYNFEEGEKGMFLYNFCVDKNYRNKNYGNELINESINLCTKLKQNYIHCNAENEISKNIFIKNNFILNRKLIINEKIYYLLTKKLL